MPAKKATSFTFPADQFKTSAHLWAIEQGHCHGDMWRVPIDAARSVAFPVPPDEPFPYPLPVEGSARTGVPVAVFAVQQEWYIDTLSGDKLKTELDSLAEWNGGTTQTFRGKGEGGEMQLAVRTISIGAVAAIQQEIQFAVVAGNALRHELPATVAAWHEHLSRPGRTDTPEKILAVRGLPCTPETARYAVRAALIAANMSPSDIDAPIFPTRGLKVRTVFVAPLYDYARSTWQGEAITTLTSSRKWAGKVAEQFCAIETAREAFWDAQGMARQTGDLRSQNGKSSLMVVPGMEASLRDALATGRHITDATGFDDHVYTLYTVHARLTSKGVDVKSRTRKQVVSTAREWIRKREKGVVKIV